VPALVSTAGGGEERDGRTAFAVFLADNPRSRAFLTLNTLLNPGEPSLYILEESPRPYQVQSNYDCDVRGHGLRVPEV